LTNLTTPPLFNTRPNGYYIYEVVLYTRSSSIGLLDPENMKVAVEISLLSCLQAES